MVYKLEKNGASNWASIYRLKLHLQDLQQMLGEVEPGKEMALFEAKQPASRLDIQSRPVTADIPSDKSEIEHTKSQATNAESRVV